MQRWLEAGYLECAIKSAFGGLRTLLQDSALCMSHDVDFGVVDLSQIASLSADAADSLRRWQALLPPHAVRPQPSGVAVPGSVGSGCGEVKPSNHEFDFARGKSR